MTLQIEDTEALNDEVRVEQSPTHFISANSGHGFKVDLALHSNEFKLDKFDGKRFISVQKPLQNEHAKKVLQMKQQVGQDALRP